MILKFLGAVFLVIAFNCLASDVELHTDGEMANTNLSGYGINMYDRQWMKFEVKSDKNVAILFLKGCYGEYNFAVSLAKDEIAIESMSGVLKRISGDFQLDKNKFTTFWIGWRDSVINVGNGTHFPTNEILNISAEQMNGTVIGIKSTSNAYWRISKDYLGCFNSDSASGPVLEDSVFTSRFPTVQECIDKCEDRKAKYSAYLISDFCTCGNVVRSGVKVLDEEECGATVCSDNCDTGPTAVYLSEVICDTGSYRHDNDCLPCPLGYYQSEQNQVYCEVCSDQMTTNQTGSTSQDQCLYENVGCFHPVAITTPSTVYILPDTTNSISYCLTYCASDSKLYAFQNGLRCFCDDNLDRWSPLDVSSLCTLSSGTGYTAYKTQRHFVPFTTSNSMVSLSTHGLDIAVSKELRFLVKGCEGATIKLFEDNASDCPLAVIKIEVDEIEIREHGRKRIDYDGQNILKCDTFSPFWIDWSNRLLEIGTGLNVSGNTLLSMFSNSLLDVNHVTVGERNSDVCWMFEGDIDSSLNTGTPCKNFSAVAQVNTTEYDQVNMTAGYDQVNMTAGYDQVNMTAGYDQVNMTAGYDQVNMTAGYDQVNTTTQYDNVQTTDDYDQVLPIGLRECACNCTRTSSRKPNLTETELHEKLNEMTSALRIDIKSTNTFVRTKTSAKDERPSSTYIGYACGVSIFTLLSVGLLILDAPNLKRMCLQIMQNIRN